MIDLIFVVVVCGFAVELAALYEIYQLASDVQRQLAEMRASLPRPAGSPWPATSGPRPVRPFGARR